VVSVEEKRGEEVTIDEMTILKAKKIKYLGSIIQRKEKMDEDIKPSHKCGLVKKKECFRCAM